MRGGNAFVSADQLAGSSAGMLLASAAIVTGLPARLSRYASVAKLLLKYGRDLSGSPDEQGETADSLARDLEQLGPTFIKLGQVLSTRPELLPPSYLEALARLQDAVEPFPFAEVQQTIEAELGV